MSLYNVLLELGPCRKGVGVAWVANIIIHVLHNLSKLGLVREHKARVAPRPRSKHLQLPHETMVFENQNHAAISS